MTKARPTDCVIKVGDGRGFIIVNRVKVPPMKLRRRIANLRPAQFVKHRLIVTAAHCWSASVPAHALAYAEERMCKRLGTLDGSKKGVWAECLFVDPIADIAIFGCPDGQEFSDEAAAYDDLTENAPVLEIAEAKRGPGWVLSLDRKWARTTLVVHRGIGGVGLSIGPTKPGMSGSPILNYAGRAVGVVVIGGGSTKNGKRITKEFGPQPILTRNLPGWLLQ